MDTTEKDRPGDGPDKERGYTAWAIVIAAAVICASIRFHLLNVPLERDEGEYAYAAQLMLKGIPPYEFMHSLKLPGVFTVYALIMLAFGQTAAGIHLGLLLINFLTVILVFLLGRKLLDPLPAALSGAFFAVLSLSSSFAGLSANTEHFAVFFIVGGILFLFKGMEARKAPVFFLSGFFFGLAFLMKQHAALFMALPVVYFSAMQLRRRLFAAKEVLRIPVVFFLGALLPFGLTCLVFRISGAFDEFWFWTFSYALEYVSIVDIPLGLFNLKHALSGIMSSAAPLLAVSAIGLVFPPPGKRPGTRFLFLWAFFAVSFISICPGLYFRDHYFIFMLPSAALLFGAGMSRINRFFMKYGFKAANLVTVSVAIVLLAYPLYRERTLLFFSAPDEVSRMISGLNPFPEAVEVARYIKEHSNPDDRIAVLGSEPQIYFLSDRLSATGHIYMYPLFEPHGYAMKMRQGLLKDIEEGKPLFLVFVNVSTSWSTPRRYVTGYFSQFDLSGYATVGLVEIKASGTLYRWDDQINEDTEFPPPDRSWLLVLRRRP